MKDIKTLYLTAKRSGNANDISSYTEAVNELLESNPNGFIANLEYIISSDINLPAINQFVEKYGLAIPLCNGIIDLLEQCIDKCDTYHKDSSLFKESLDAFRGYRSMNHTCFDMYEYYMEDVRERMSDADNKYIEKYYGFNTSGIQGRKLPAGMIGVFGESAIPDALITSRLIGNDRTLTTVYEYISSKYISPEINQWIVECSAEIEVDNNSTLNTIAENALSALVSNKNAEFNQLVRESVITSAENVYNVYVEYTESDIQNILDLISMREYQITCTESTEEAERIQNEVYSLYESLDGIADESDFCIYESGSDKKNTAIEDIKSIITEGRFDNTDNKYTGSIPSYLRKNHDLEYGEVDGGGKDIATPEDEYLRPSAKTTDTPTIDSGETGSHDADDHEDDVDNKSTAQAVNNYYYYQYTNSLNKNTGSFNKSTDSHDDHSTNKRIHSDGDNIDKQESSVPIGLNLGLLGTDPITESSTAASDLYMSNSITESTGDADDMRPQSDHPIKDAMRDVDQKLVKTQQAAKKQIQGVINTGRTFIKPVKRTHQWVMKMVNDWKDSNETKLKEKIADPHARKGLFSAITWCIKTGSLMKAGLLFNPIFMFLSITKNIGKKDKLARVRSEMIGEIKTEMEIIKVKIDDAASAVPPDNKAKYKLMRLRNELNKKLLRVGGSDVRSWKKLL